MNTVDTCIQFQSLISAELDGELDVQEQAELQGHLAECAVCVRWRATASRLAHQLASIDEVDGEQWVPIHANGHARPVQAVFYGPVRAGGFGEVFRGQLAR